jgi:antitoxin component YwqK of YwqJK toxin-antitoxin module
MILFNGLLVGPTSKLMDLLDDACLFELLVRLHYADLVNICKVYNKLHRITCTPHFQECWNKYNILTQVVEIGDNIMHKQYDRLNNRQGKTLTYNRKGALIEETNWIHGYKHGEAMTYKSSGNRFGQFKIHYDNDAIHGPALFVSESGDVEHYVYKNDKRHGLAKCYKTDGTIYFEEYIDDNSSGFYLKWSPNGQRLLMETRGRSGGIIYRSFNENGVKRQEYTLVNGHIDGVYKSWDENSKLVCENFYEKGVFVK